MLFIVFCLLGRNRANRQGSSSCPSSPSSFSIHYDDQRMCEATSCCVALFLFSCANVRFQLRCQVYSVRFVFLLFFVTSMLSVEEEGERDDVTAIGWWWFCLYDWSGWEAHQSRRLRLEKFRTFQVAGRFLQSSLYSSITYKTIEIIADKEQNMRGREREECGHIVWHCMRVRRRPMM